MAWRCSFLLWACLACLLLTGKCRRSKGAAARREQRPVSMRPKHLTGVGQFNVKDFGAVGDGVHNDTQAFVDAFSNCSRASLVVYAEVYVPDGKYALSPFTIHHCKDCVFRIHGSLLAPRTSKSWGDAPALITVHQPENFTINGDGKGVINGRARQRQDQELFEWTAPQKSFDFGLAEDIPIHFSGPALLLITSDNDAESRVDDMFGTLRNISLRNAPGVHALVNGQPQYFQFFFTAVQIHAGSSEDDAWSAEAISHPVHGVVGTNASLVFDGSSLRNSGENIFLHDPVGEGSRMYIGMYYNAVVGGNSGVTLVMQDGYFGNMSLFQNSFIQSRYAVRILATQIGHGHMEGFYLSFCSMRDVGTPFLVDTFWCPEGQTCRNSSTGGVKLDLIDISSVNGTQTSGLAGSFRCDALQTCNINLMAIYLKSSSGPHGTNEFQCWNAEGTADNVYPPSCLKTFYS